MIPHRSRIAFVIYEAPQGGYFVQASIPAGPDGENQFDMESAACCTSLSDAERYVISRMRDYEEEQRELTRRQTIEESGNVTAFAPKKRKWLFG